MAYKIKSARVKKYNLALWKEINKKYPDYSFMKKMDMYLSLKL